jgi:hypothetical protein
MRNKNRRFTESDERVISLLRSTSERVETIREPVSFNKRYDRTDKEDPYGQVIEYVYKTGSTLFGSAK